MERNNLEIFKIELQKLDITEENKWKTYLHFPSHVLFLDIETEGLSKNKNDITLIGTYRNGIYLPFIKDINLEKSLKILNETPIWITFGGENFDIPFIKKKFPFLETPIIHLDLFLLTKKIGLKGGLKKIEKFLGISRETDGLNGYDAVKLWQKWVEYKDKKALRKLIIYNKEDVVNLKKVMNYVIKKLSKKEKEGNFYEKEIQFSL